MRRTLDELALARRTARANLLAAVADIRDQLSPAKLRDDAKALLRARLRAVASASMRQATAHQGVIVGAIAAALPLLIVNLIAKPQHSDAQEPRHD